MEKKESVRNRITSILTRRFAEHELEANPLGEAKEVFRIELETIDEIVLYIESLLTTPSVRGEEFTKEELNIIWSWAKITESEFGNMGTLAMPHNNTEEAEKLFEKIEKLLSPQTTEGESK